MGFYFGVGVTVAMPGPALEVIREDFGLGYTAVGVAAFSPAIGYMVGTLFGGPLADRVGRRRLIVASTALVAVCLALIAASPNVGVFVLLSVGYGIGFGGAEPGLTALIGDAAGRSTGCALAITHAPFGLGAVAAAPMIGRFIDAGAGWRPAFLVAAALVGAATIAFAFVPDVRARAPALAAGAVLRVMAAPLPLLLGTAIALYFGMEIAIGGFLAAHLERTFEVERSLAASAVVVFWAGLFVGRLFAAWAADRFGLLRMAVSSAILASIFSLIAGLAPTSSAALVGAGFAGLAIAPLFPAVLAIGVTRRPSASGAMLGSILAVGGMGAVALAPHVGGVADVWDVRASILTAPVMLAIAAVVLAAAARAR